MDEYDNLLKVNEKPLIEESEDADDIEVDDESEEYEEIDDFDGEEGVKSFASITEKKLRIQMITQEVKKLLSERDDLERDVDLLEDDVPVED